MNAFGPRIRRILISAVLCVAPAMPHAESMDLQRCIWACLAGSPGAASAQYQQCVQRSCTAPQSGWISGPTADGTRYFAGFEEPGTQLGFYYLCKGRTESFFTLTGLEGPDAQMQFVISGVRYLVPFSWVGGDFRIDQLPGAPFMNAITSAQSMQVFNSSGHPIMTLQLAGAGAAIQSAVDACYS